jgi:hypothetical protein
MRKCRVGDGTYCDEDLLKYRLQKLHQHIDHPEWGHDRKILPTVQRHVIGHVLLFNAMLQNYSYHEGQLRVS